jgi:hypothetical protein
VPAHMRLAALEAVRAQLEPLATIPSPQVSAEIIDAVLELALGPWIRLGDLTAVAVEVRQNLPWEFRDASDVSTAAVETAVVAMNDLLAEHIHATTGDLRTVATAPVQAVVATFRHGRRCQKLLEDRWWLRLPDGTAEEQAQAKAAVATALREQPAIASERNLEAARDTALVPFHAAIAQARDEQQARAQAEARRTRERNYRTSLLQPIWLALSDLSGAEGEQALAAIREALDALPAGTSQGELSGARDRAFKAFLDARALRLRDGRH